MTEKKPTIFMSDLLHYNPTEQYPDSETVQGFAMTHRQVSNMYMDGTIDPAPLQETPSQGLGEGL